MSRRSSAGSGQKRQTQLQINLQFCSFTSSVSFIRRKGQRPDATDTSTRARAAPPSICSCPKASARAPSICSCPKHLLVSAARAAAPETLSAVSASPKGGIGGAGRDCRRPQTTAARKSGRTMRGGTARQRLGNKSGRTRRRYESKKDTRDKSGFVQVGTRKHGGRAPKHAAGAAPRGSDSETRRHCEAATRKHGGTARQQAKPYVRGGGGGCWLPRGSV